MPRFDFQCFDCGHVFEHEVSFGTRRVPRCPACGGKTEKLIAPPAIHFKGGGFYATDSRVKQNDVKKQPESTKSELPKASPKDSPKKEK
ncbi:MAG: zinc ribbon domain-containing protein [Candidatus Peribacteraceae bacterium]|nr:zinc ribbon domain-containing protein [Candidatus Peribacteraceae bacterium]